MSTSQDNVELSILSQHEPRPGENTYSRRDEKGYARPNIQDLRMPMQKLQRVGDLFNDEPSESADTANDVDADSLLSSPIKPNPRTNSYVEPPRPSKEEASPAETSAANAQLATKFGMWDGVFARCLLNIFGVIMFLRIPWMVAYAGIWHSLFIILASVSITTISATSLSAICTNGLVANGGAYYMISRSLGPEYGGAIGVMFFFANAVACPMYLIGFAETIVGMNDSDQAIIAEGWDLQLFGILSLLFICIICFAGLKYVIKFQLGLLGLLILSILAFIIGCFIEHPELPGYGGINANNWNPDWNHATAYVGPVVNGTQTTLLCPHQAPGATSVQKVSAGDTLGIIDSSVTFGIVLAVFFPAVTGIMAGANISGDLKDPSYAIPTGTNLALFVSTIIYCMLTVLVGISGVRSVAGIVTGTDCPFGGLFHDSLYMARVSVWPPIVYAGIFASTLSSAIASLVGAPRILQAVAKDKLFPGISFLEKGYGVNNEPIAAYIVTIIITVACCLIGNLNAIAPLITNFFMGSYALTNLACYQASDSRSPGWRPTFKYYNKWVSLFGVFICIGFMLFLNVWMSFFTIVIGMILYTIVKKISPDVNWGSAGAGAKYIVAHRNLLSLKKAKDHVKNWRPQVLAIVNEDGTEEEDKVMVSLVRELKKGHGVNIIGSIVTGDLSADGGLNPALVEKAGAKKNQLESIIQSTKTKAFAQVACDISLRSGVRAMVQMSGLGDAIKPNTFILPFKDDWASMSPADLANYVGMIGDAFDCGYGVVLLRRPELYGENVARAQKSSKVERAISKMAPLSNRTLKSSDEDDTAPPNSLDVWWLSDDGGLTLLLPHLIVRNRRRYDAKTPMTMRVMNTIGEDELGRAGRELTRLDALVNFKFRIGAKVVNVILENKWKGNPELEARVDDQWKTVQETIAAAAQEGDEAMKKSEEQQRRFIAETKGRLKLGETIANHSKKASLVCINIPVPRKDKMVDPWYPYQYMSWLDALSHHDKPCLLIHGSNVDCLTFYS